MGKVLAILDKEEDYVLYFMEYIKNLEEYGFTFIAFTDETAYMEYESESKIDVLLYNENIESSFLDYCNADKKICLRESKQLLSHDSEESVFKFQSAESIMRDLALILMKENYEYRIVKTNLNTKVIGVWFPSHAGFGSNISFILAKEISKIRSTLFISFNPLFSSGEIESCEEAQGLADAIYYCKQKNQNFSIKVKSTIGKSDALEFIVGVFHWSDMAELTEEDTEMFMMEILNNLSYDTIIIDLGLLCNATNKILDYCDIIYHPLIREESENPKRELLRQIQLKQGGDFINKLDFVEVSNQELLIKGSTFGKAMKEGDIYKIVKLLIQKEEEQHGYSSGL